MEADMDVAGVHHHHHQELSSQTLESMLQSCTKPQDDKKPRPPEEPVKCPRCDSGNTKFCYYNNYSLTQPRYFCKSCRRYWTKGGTLRNVPVGGGCRKNNKRNSSSSSSSSAANSSNSSPCSAPSKMRSGPQQHPSLNFFTPSSNNHLLAGLPQLSYDSTSIGYHQFDHYLGANIGGQLGFLENTSNLVYNNNNNIGNGDMGLNINDQQYHILNPMFHDHQEQELIAVKQEACNMMRSSEVGLMGFQGNMVHEVESMIGGWNGIGATNWHGLINSPLM